MDPGLLIPSPSKLGGLHSKTTSAQFKRAASSTDRLKRQLLNTVRSHKLAVGKTMSRKTKRLPDIGAVTGGIQISDALKRGMKANTRGPSAQPLITSVLPPKTAVWQQQSLSVPIAGVHTSPTSVDDKKTSVGEKTPWGNLKHGKKPTFRKWSRTVRTAGQSHIRFDDTCECDDGKQARLTSGGACAPSADISEHEHAKNKLDEMELTLTDIDLTSIDSVDDTTGANAIHVPNSLPVASVHTPPPEPIVIVSPSIIGYDGSGHLNSANRAEVKVVETFVPKKKITRKFTRKTFKVGKNGGGTSVFFKKTIRRKTLPVQMNDDQGSISIESARQFLHDRNIIKRGSSTPDKLIFEMYNSIKCGSDIVNERDDIQVHNFMEN